MLDVNQRRRRRASPPTHASNSSPHPCTCRSPWHEESHLMSLLANGYAKELRERFSERLRALPGARQVQRAATRIGRRWLRKVRTPKESPNLLPLLIQVLAAFSRSARGDVLEEEIDSSLGFL